MKVYENQLYNEDLDYISNLNIPWEKLVDKSIMITGATGQIGSMLIDTLMRKNKQGLNCTIYALGRSIARVRERFEYCYNNRNFCFVEYDVNRYLFLDEKKTIDYVLHLASNTHPLQYANDPIGTITTNIIGVHNLLDFAFTHNTTRFLFASSNEIYGENRGDVEKFDEKYCGYIDCNTIRAGYPESKRCGEALCQAYKAQKGLDIVITRLTRSYGPTLLSTDTKALSQFINNAIKDEDIVLKSEGKQYYSFLHVTDSVSGLFTILLKGENGGAYNVADEASDIMLKDLAKIIADYVGRKVIYKAPESIEYLGYSKVTKSRLDSRKLINLGWKAKYNIEQGIHNTIDILKDIR